MVYNKIYIVYAVLIAACGSKPDFVSSHGTSVYLRGHVNYATARQINTAEDWFITELDGSWDRTAVVRCMLRLDANIVDAPVQGCGPHCSGDEINNGIWRPGDINVAAINQCIYDSAYIHEVGHWLQSCVKDTYDPSHQKPDMWPLADTHPPFTCTN